MRLENARDAYESLSGKASDIVRQISLAGVALIWVFKSGTGLTFFLNPVLLRAALFIFLALLFDFLQYLVGATVWFVYYRFKEIKGTKESDDFLAPPQLNWVMWTFFYLKSGMMLVAYVGYLIPFLLSKVSAS